MFVFLTIVNDNIYDFLVAKSAVDTSSPVPPGVTGRSSDTSCVCPPLGTEGLLI